MLPESVFSLILHHEGGDRITDDPADPGGLTRWGISQRAYPDLDIRNLTREQAREIYDRDYWQACRCDDLPRSVAVLVMDCAVNQGVPTACRLLQFALGVPKDGVIGPVTVAAARAMPSAGVCRDLAQLRAARYAVTAGWDRYGIGWMRRLIHVLTEALTGR